MTHNANSDKTHRVTVKEGRSDWGEVAFVVCVFLAFILCVGTPDLLDAIVSRVMRQ